MFRQFAQGEEGVDYFSSVVKDPNMPDPKLLEKQIRREINQLKMVDPEKAKSFDELIFKRNEIDDILAT